MTPRGSTLLIAFLAALLGAWAFGSPDPGSTPLAVCRHSGADGGEARRVDLDRVGQRQAILKGAFRRQLEAPELSPRAVPRERPGDSFVSGVPGCVRAERRRYVLPEPLPPPLRARRLFFLGAPPPGAEPNLALGPLAPLDLLFVLDSPGARDLAALGRKLSREITVASPAFSERLGVRCVPSRVEISPDGQTLAIEEARP